MNTQKLLGESNTCSVDSFHLALMNNRYYYLNQSYYESLLSENDFTF